MRWHYDQALYVPEEWANLRLHVYHRERVSYRMLAERHESHTLTAHGKALFGI